MAVVVQARPQEWRQHVHVPGTSGGAKKDGDNDSHAYFTDIFRRGHHGDALQFPDPKGINVKTMPFVMARTFEASKLPEYLKPYWPMIEFCVRAEFEKLDAGVPDSELQCGKIGYLTVQEGFIEAGELQRRPGIHVDCPVRKCDEKKSGNGERLKWGRGFCELTKVDEGSVITGSGERIRLTGGIYLANNFSDTCRGYDCAVLPDGNGKEVIGRYSRIDHLREILPPPRPLRANRMYWMTDRTPHEALPMPASGHRQFFRLVTSDVDKWYVNVSTPNPNGIRPDEAIVDFLDDNETAFNNFMMGDRVDFSSSWC